MNQILKGLRVVEGSAFVAVPLGGMTLTQLGAEVIRFDPIQGGLDARRWPVTAEGKSLYWAGLNKGKLSIAVDTRQPEGRELITNLVTAPGPDNGLFITNFPPIGWMSYEALKTKREDLIMCNLVGNPDGTSAIDYTVNCAIGIPYATGPEHGDYPVNPVNHVLPAWDAVAGITVALGILAAERHRRLKGEGQFIKFALSDIAMAMAGNLGFIGEAQINRQDRPSYGNYLYGNYGREFATKDGRLVYIAAITKRQWVELGKATGLTERFAMINPMLDVDLNEESDRFKAREAISAVLAPWCAERSLDEVRLAFEGTGVCWGPYQTPTQLIEEDPRCSTANPLFAEIEQPGIGRYLVPGSPLDFSGFERQTPRRAPILGEHTDEVLSTMLALTDAEIGGLRDRKIVAGPVEL